MVVGFATDFLSIANMQVFHVTTSIKYDFLIMECGHFEFRQYKIRPKGAKTVKRHLLWYKAGLGHNNNM